MVEDHLVTIAIRLSTRQRLKTFGKMNDTYGSVINKLLDMAGAQAGKQTKRLTAKEILSRYWKGKRDFRHLDLAGLNLKSACLGFAYFTGSNLANANLEGADLELSDFIDADLSGANLKEADLTGADLIGAELKYADLRGADLRSAKLERANLFNTNLEGAIIRLGGSDFVIKGKWNGKK